MRDWFEQYIIFYLLCAIVLYMLPKDCYRKYISFLIRMLLVVILFVPLLQKINSGFEEELLAGMQDVFTEQGMDDTEKIEEMRDKYVGQREENYREYSQEQE